MKPIFKPPFYLKNISKHNFNDDERCTYLYKKVKLHGKMARFIYKEEHFIENKINIPLIDILFDKNKLKSLRCDKTDVFHLLRQFAKGKMLQKTEFFTKNLRNKPDKIKKAQKLFTKQSSYLKRYKNEFQNWRDKIQEEWEKVVASGMVDKDIVNWHDNTLEYTLDKFSNCIDTHINTICKYKEAFDKLIRSQEDSKKNPIKTVENAIN